jgi:Flp pilus assembly protein TadD
LQDDRQRRLGKPTSVKGVRHDFLLSQLLHYTLRRFSEAVPVLQSLSKYEGKDISRVHVLISLGSCLNALARGAEAVAPLEEAFRLSSCDPVARLELAVALAWADQKQRSKEVEAKRARTCASERSRSGRTFAPGAARCGGRTAGRTRSSDWRRLW